MSITPAEAQVSLQGALLETQLLAESRMRWSCRVYRVPGGTITDEDGYDIPAPATLIYEGMWRKQTFRPFPESVDVGGARVVKANPDAHLPAVERIPVLVESGAVVADVAAQPFRTNDVIVHDVGGTLVAYRVTDSNHKTDQTAQRLPVEDADQGWQEVLP